MRTLNSEREDQSSFGNYSGRHFELANLTRDRRKQGILCHGVQQGSNFQICVELKFLLIIVIIIIAIIINKSKTYNTNTEYKTKMCSHCISTVKHTNRKFASG
jgi:hypothetical protein